MSSKAILRNNWILRLRIYGGLLSLVSLVIPIIAYFGANHWVLDLFNHFLPYYVIGLALGTLALILSYSFRWAIGSAIVALAVFGITHFFFNEDKMRERTDSVKVISFNVYTPNPDKYQVSDWLASNIQPDFTNIVLLMEVDNTWIQSMDALKQHLPNTLEIPRDDNFGIALYTNGEIISISKHFFDLSDIPAIVAKIRTKDGELNVVGIHTLPPISKGNFWQRNLYIQNLKDFISNLTGPIVIAGDFNATPWSPHFSKQVYNCDDSKVCLKSANRKFPLRNTWVQGPFRMPIDHILYSGLNDPHFEVGPSLGSDHLPILAEF